MSNSMQGPPVSLYQAESLAPTYVTTAGYDSGLCGPRGGNQSLASLRYMGGGTSGTGEVKLSETVKLANCRRDTGVTSQVGDDKTFANQTLTDRRRESSVLDNEKNFPPLWDSAEKGWAVSTHRDYGYETYGGAQYINIWQWTDVNSTGKSKVYEAFVNTRQTYRKSADHFKKLSLLTYSSQPYNGLVGSTSTSAEPFDMKNIRIAMSCNVPAKVVMASLELTENLSINTNNKQIITVVDRLDLKEVG